MIPSLGGLNAVQAGAGVAPTAPAQPSVSAAGPSFADVLSEVSAGAVSTLRGAETAAISGITGKSSVQDVVQAVMSAEQTLQAAIAIRDKVVAAYQEVSRMAI